ncbi:hemolysin family protein [Alkalibacterium iburiense]|uniref:Hemolysin family protein n=1 Tax=Alkalibacterium iburiense TaxID=290589 RepID=A0ABP3H336_9LACT
MAVAVITLIILILVNGFFAASELAFVNLNDNKVKRLAYQGDKKAKKLYQLISNPSLFLSTIQIGITLAGFLSSAFAADFFAGPIAETLYNWGVPLSLGLLNTLSVVVVTIVLSYFTLVFGELVPKQLALQNAEKIAEVAVGPVSLLAKISAPVVKFLSFSINMVLKLFGIDPDAENEEATEEDIRLLVDLGKERGNINPAEELMIKNIFEFDDTTVLNIMTHRTDMTALSVEANFEEVLKEINETRFTRYPVYEEEVDNIIGILHVKDLFEYQEKKGPFNLREIIRQPHYVLDSQTIDVVFKKMQQGNTHLAIVTDEFGGTQGLVTIEDVLEEIVGEISSESLESEFDEIEIKKLSDKQYLVKGSTRLRDIESVLGVSLPSDQYETVRGFMISRLGYIPTKTTHQAITHKHVNFEIKKIEENRIESILLTLND